jgi:hypothetical protein
VAGFHNEEEPTVHKFVELYSFIKEADVTPSGRKLFTTVRDLMPRQRLLSMELAFGVKEKDILPDKEKYVRFRGLRFRISIPHQDDVVTSSQSRV